MPIRDATSPISAVALRLHHFVAIGRELGLAHNVLGSLTEERLPSKTLSRRTLQLCQLKLLRKSSVGNTAGQRRVMK